jgi:hypothetical protein
MPYIEFNKSTVLPQTGMTVLNALAILEAAVLECKKRDSNTPQVTEALDFLEVSNQWLNTRPAHHDFVG